MPPRLSGDWDAEARKGQPPRATVGGVGAVGPGALLPNKDKEDEQRRPDAPGEARGSERSGPPPEITHGASKATGARPPAATLASQVG